MWYSVITFYNLKKNDYNLILNFIKYNIIYFSMGRYAYDLESESDLYNLNYFILESNTQL